MASDKRNMTYDEYMGAAKVVSTEIRYGLKTNSGNIPVRIVCTFDNGAVWSCLENMTDWEKERPPYDELTHSFDAFQGPKPRRYGDTNPPYRFDIPLKDYLRDDNKL